MECAVTENREENENYSSTNNNRQQLYRIYYYGDYTTATSHKLYVGWRSGSVIFGWRTFPVLCLIYGWQMTTSWVNCLLWVSHAGQLSLPSLWGW